LAAHHDRGRADGYLICSAVAGQLYLGRKRSAVRLPGRLRLYRRRYDRLADHTGQEGLRLPCAHEDRAAEPNRPAEMRPQDGHGRGTLELVELYQLDVLSTDPQSMSIVMEGDHMAQPQHNPDAPQYRVVRDLHKVLERLSSGQAKGAIGENAEIAIIPTSRASAAALYELTNEGLVALAVSVPGRKTKPTKSAFEPSARAKALLRGKEIIERDLAAAEGAFNLEEVTNLLGISRRAVAAKVKDDGVLTVPVPGNGRVYPTFRFTRAGVPMGLRDVLKALRSDNPWF